MSDTFKSPTPTAHSTPLWRNVSFTLMWTSTAASGFGDRMIMLAALALLGGLSHTADSAGVQASTQFFFFAPYLVFNLLGGWLADRMPRKWLLMLCDESRGLILLAAIFMLLGAAGPAMIPTDRHWQVYLALAGIGAFAAIFNPTRNAIIPQLVPERQLQSGNAVILVINVVFGMVGMVVGTKFIINPESIGSVRVGLMCGALFYLVSGWFFVFMRPIHEIHSEARKPRALGEAVQYSVKHRRVLLLYAVNIMVWGSAALVSTGVMGVLKIHYLLEGEELFHSFGYVSATMGTGMIVGAALVVIIGTHRESTIVLTTGLILAGLFTLILALVPLLSVTYAAAFCIGVFGNVAIISSLTILQSITPNHVRGRIMGLNAMIDTVFSISIYGIIWLIPGSDHWVLIIMLVLGPILMITGAIALVRHLFSGPMPNRTANFCWRVNRLFCFSWHGLAVIGKHHIPATGPVVIAANHTTAMDPFLIQAGTIRMVRWLMLTAYRLPVANFMWNAIQPICIELDTETGERSGAMRQVRQIVGELKQGDVVGMFPEGRLQYDDRVIKEFEQGAAAVARLAGATIVPCWVDGTVVSRSMIAHALKPTHSSVTFGQPFVPGKDQSAEEITAEIRRRVLALGEVELKRRAEL